MYVFVQNWWPEKQLEEQRISRGDVKIGGREREMIWKAGGCCMYAWVLCVDVCLMWGCDQKRFKICVVEIRSQFLQ